jgi:hypothetical protein
MLPSACVLAARQHSLQPPSVTAAAAGPVPRRRRLHIGSWSSPDGHAQFMFDPITDTLIAGVAAIDNSSLWNVTVHYGNPLDAQAVSHLSELVCGDVFVWVGLMLDRQGMQKWRHMLALLPTLDLKARGVNTALYQTEPLQIEQETFGLIPPELCLAATSPFSEVWDYSHANLKRIFEECPEAGDRPVQRYVPPGRIKDMAARRNAVVSSCRVDGMVSFVGKSTGSRNRWLRRLQAEAVTLQSPMEVAFSQDRWSWDELAEALGSCLQLSVHKADANATLMPFEALRAAPLLSAGALLVSQQSDPDDEAAWAGLVYFAESPESAAVELARLAAMPDDVRGAIARQRAEEFDRRFDPAALLASAGISTEVLGPATMQACLATADDTTGGTTREKAEEPQTCHSCLETHCRRTSLSTAGACPDCTREQCPLPVCLPEERRGFCRGRRRGRVLVSD